MNQEIGILGTEKTQSIKVQIKDYKGRTYVDMRAWFKGTDGTWYPTKKGLFVAEDKISSLITFLEQAEATLKNGVLAKA